MASAPSGAPFDLAWRGKTRSLARRLMIWLRMPGLLTVVVEDFQVFDVPAFGDVDEAGDAQLDQGA